MYGAFSLFNYQLKEINRLQGKAAVHFPVSFDEAKEMINNFIAIALRQDIWSGHEFWKPMVWSHKELLQLQIDIDKELEPEHYEDFLSYCSEVIWHKLTNLSNMYEELVREWFMPTLLATLTSARPK